jgi:1-deoxy-D-xylulose-5-phosphate reductoisomerase
MGYITGHRPEGVDKIILTASGGPFRTLPLAQFVDITPAQAVAHPNWSMGAKISVDSASMMNKGLELIEAYWLFKMEIENIEVVLHPQSIIHSMVCYRDGSTLAQLGLPDMRTPIAYALSWPERIHAGVKGLNLLEVGQLNFEPVSNERFPALQLAYEVLKSGGTTSAILNAANEEAVAAFLAGQIRFVDIVTVISQVLDQSSFQPADSFETILEADRQARAAAKGQILHLSLRPRNKSAYAVDGGAS